MSPTPYSHLIHYLGGQYEKSNDLLADLRMLFEASPWGIDDISFNSLIWHLMQCWKLFRGGAEIHEHHLFELLTENLNPNSMLNKIFGDDLLYEERLINALLGKISSTKMTDIDGNPKFKLLPVNKILKGNMSSHAAASKNINVVMIPSAHRYKVYENEDIKC